MPGYFVRTMLGMVSAAALFCGAGVARAQEQPRPPETQAEEGAPLTLEVIYTGDVIGGASGGLERGVRYLDNLFVTADGDLGRLAGWDGAVFQVDVLNNLGGRPNDLAGSLQGVDNIEVPQPRLKLYEAWIEQRFGDAGSLRVGLYDLNSEFYVNESAALLISPSFGIGSELAATGTNGPSIFPSTALAARLRWNFDDLYAQAVVINAKAGTLGYAGGIDLSGREGVLFVGEGGWAEGNGKIAAGAWQYSKKQPEVVPPGLTETGRDVLSRGIYAVLEHDLLGTPRRTRQCDRVSADRLFRRQDHAVLRRLAGGRVGDACPGIAPRQRLFAGSGQRHPLRSLPCGCPVPAGRRDGDRGDL